MTGILDQFEDIADANSPYGNTRDRRGSKRGKRQMGTFFRQAKSLRSKIKHAQAMCATKKSKHKS